MWEKFMKCFNKGPQTPVCQNSISELYKRVPPNQREQFKVFAKKNEEYKIRLQKYPSEMPQIDWNFYKQNVRKEMVSWVDEFENKYDNLDNIFANRHNLIDHSKYFGEVNEQTKEVECEVKKYKEASNERIKLLQAKMEYLKGLKPYVEMTMEEFCLAHPNEAPDFINKPTFWPHTPEEQKPGPSEELAHKEAESVDPKPKSKDAGPDPKKSPPKSPPTGDKPQAPPTGKDAPPKPKDASPTAKDASPTAKDAKPKDPIENQACHEKDKKRPEAKATSKSDIEGQAVEVASQMATKGVAIVQDLSAKLVTLLKTLWKKFEEKRKQVAASAEAVRLKNEAEKKKKKASMLAAKTKQTIADDEEDSYFRRESASDICHKTIIRGEDTAKADVKPHHVDLDIEQKEEQDDCKKDKKCAKDENDTDCERKTKCDEEDDRDCERKTKCEEEEKNTCRPEPKCSVPQKGENYCDFPLAVSDDKSKKDSPTCESSQMIGDKMTELSTKTENITTDNRKGLVETTIVSSESQQDKTSIEKDVPDTEEAKFNKLNTDKLAKSIFKMTYKSATLIAEAESMVKVAQHETNGDIESLRSVYEAAGQKVSQALGQAYMALSSARKLAKQTTDESNDLSVKVKKHANLAKLLAQRAIEMKTKIGKLLSKLEKYD